MIGKARAQRVPEKPARLTVLSLAPAGGLTTLGKGLWGRRSGAPPIFLVSADVSGGENPVTGGCHPA
ncbi:hypothetical protein ACQPYK_26170 [Streptosporangium sp. CA-135522]|uniref:hypothetical protein n=1 Tax=Streptosporangium sp. CA-135522 TaxID=3240072 RepID=UPI003D92B0E4